jgi:hypothetical protein
MITKAAGLFYVMAAEPATLEELEGALTEPAPVTQRSPVSEPPISGERPVDVRMVTPRKPEPVEFETTVTLDDGSQRDVKVSANLVAEDVLIFDAETGEDLTDSIPSENFDDGFVKLLSYYALK